MGRDAFSAGDGAREPAGEIAADGVRRGAGVRLSTLLPRARFVACDDIVARGCHDDPRACREGDVFVARLDAAADGHDLAAQAIARGVSGIVAERMIPTFGVPLCLVPDSSWARARIRGSMAAIEASRLARYVNVRTRTDSYRSAIFLSRSRICWLFA